MELAEDHLGDLLEDVSPSLEQEKRLWSTIESLEWPAAYMEDIMNIQESFLRYYAEHPDEYMEVLALSERIAALDELPEDSPEVERLVEDYVRYAKASSLPQAAQRGPDWTAEPMGSVFFEIMTTSTSPARRRFFELCRERLEIRRTEMLNEECAEVAPACPDPAEVALVWSGLLDVGDAVLVLAGIEILIVLTGIGGIILFARRYRRGRAAGLDLWAALEEGLAGLAAPKGDALCPARAQTSRRASSVDFLRVTPADNEFGYHNRSILRAILPLVIVTSPVELLVVHLLASAFSPWGWVKWTLLALGLYAILWLLGFYASLVTLPHSLQEGGIQLRYGAFADGFIPYRKIASVERASRRAPKSGDGLQTSPQGDEISISISGKTDLTLLLHTPQTVEGLFKTAGPAATIHLAADEPKRLATELRGRVDQRTSPRPPALI